MRLFNKYSNYVKNKIYGFRGENLLKQEAMLRLALKEEGINYKKLVIEIDHINGVNFINGIELPIIYPKSFFQKAKKLHALEKTLTYYFNGNMSDDGGRKKILSKFYNSDSKIVESDYGRLKFTKNKFNDHYYSELATSKFGLCPHQKDFLGNKETMWTYRFIECCMVLAVPIVFKETPLGKEFLNGFYYLSDEDVLSKHIEYNYEKALKNFEWSFQKFTLSQDVVLKLVNEKDNKNILSENRN